MLTREENRGVLTPDERLQSSREVGSRRCRFVVLDGEVVKQLCRLGDRATAGPCIDRLDLGHGWWAFFGLPAEPATTLWPGSSGVPILMDQGLVAVAEETFFRGFLLFGLLQVWASAQHVWARAVAVSATAFGVLHLAQALAGSSVGTAAMSVIIATSLGVWVGVLVLLGGSVWPAALVHAATNSIVVLGAAGLTDYQPGVLSYAAGGEGQRVVQQLWVGTPTQR